MKQFVYNPISGEFDYINKSYNQIQDESILLPERQVIDFQGDGVTATDDPLNSKTIVTIPGPPATVNYGLFAQTSDSIPVTNTIVEGSLINGGVGTLTIPPNSFKVGDSFQANLSGHISSKNNDQLEIIVKTSSGILLADTGAITMPQCTSQHWDLKINFTIRALGVAGVASIASTLLFTFTKDASISFEGENVSIVNNTTFDTTISNTLEITAQWGAADPLNSIYTELFTLHKTY